MNNQYYETFKFLKIQRKEAIYNFIKKFIFENHYSPSFTQIASAVCCSSSTIQPYLKQLRDEGKIGYTEKVNRSIFLKGPDLPGQYCFDISGSIKEE